MSTRRSDNRHAVAMSMSAPRWLALARRLYFMAVVNILDNKPKPRMAPAGASRFTIADGHAKID